MCGGVSVNEDEESFLLTFFLYVSLVRRCMITQGDKQNGNIAYCVIEGDEINMRAKKCKCVSLRYFVGVYDVV